MAHTVLARKWRPKRFTDLIGQQNTVTILKNILATNRLHHAYLLTGTRGVGKTTIARIIAKALNCLNLEDNEPCCVCQNCQQIDSGRYVDVIEIDAASNTGVDNIREVLENAQYAPSSGKYKIYIIDEVHMLSKSAFNAMLKTLEEPPAHIIFILATTDPQKVPITILSRCLQLKLRNLAANEIENHLDWVLSQEQISFQKPALTILASAANGSMRDALSLTDQAIAFSNGNITETTVQQMLGLSDNSVLIAILEAIINKNSLALFSICENLNLEGANLENLLAQLNHMLFQIGIAQLVPNEDIKLELLNLARQISIQDCQLYFEISSLGMEQLKKVSNKYPCFTMTIMRMLAFSIGSSAEKEIIVSNANFKSQVVNVSTKHDSLDDKEATLPEKIISKEIENNITLEENLPISAPEEVSPVSSALDANPIPENTPPWETESQTTSNHEDRIIEQSPIIINDVQSEILPTNIASVDEFDGDWLKFTSSIDYNKYPTHTRIGMILKNSQLEKFSGHTITISVDNKFREAVNHECVDILEQLLAEHYKQDYDLEFNFVETLKESLTIQNENIKREKQLLAEEAINNDPIIQDLVNNFSAKIIPNSIKPLD
ncbi:DNA polymerase III subunit gamma/tau [Aquella oligotrophica]|uniref:DNA polymerase III subunit gamma/tau n=1 Tax=Aquella oligotrophica TaxID=2067065 RepID=A0A2I7N6Q5_9NEIS|nr:DNA polymerase III subunit gamma/tau [Aquella oligotrophica]AUR51895.1 DNA polymerase III subunit gamma/tau [Aquella oligotrophica]